MATITSVPGSGTASTVRVKLQAGSLLQVLTLKTVPRNASPVSDSLVAGKGGLNACAGCWRAKERLCTSANKWL